jgi:hypothetical protein
MLMPLLSCIARADEQTGDSPKTPPFTPTDQYEVKTIEGWRVLINPELSAEEELRNETVRELRTQLHRIVRRLPDGAVTDLRKVQIWVEREQKFPLCMCYHSIGTEWLAENGFNPDKNGGVDLGNAQNFLDWTQSQPWMVLHELAHAFHDRLPKRFKNQQIIQTYKRAMAGDKYGLVAHISGRPRDAYAANNAMEYFAEATEAFFGRNDFFPFVRTELRDYDPHAFKLMKSVWGHSDRDNYIWRVPSLPETMPWDLTALGKTPSIDWLDEKSEIRSLVYRGEPFRGKPARVFAYYATPGTLAGDTSTDVCLPAVVLVHGGGGTAFKEWVKQWAKRGYAAIAMDLAGRGAERKLLESGGPDQNDDYKFGQIDAPVSDQWSYHAVANVVSAHSLIRSFAEVDESHTAVTGISWGGYLTCIVAGIDRRFKAAVPVYGCGFLHESSVWLPRFAKMTGGQREKWVRLWDPSRYIGSANMPVFFVNGTNDFAYWPDSYAKTYELVNLDRRSYRITVNMPHGHHQGWAPKEIGLFIDHHLLGAPALPEIRDPEMSGGKVKAKVKRATELKSAELHFTTGTGQINKRQWKTVAARLDDDTILADAPPDDTTIWFFTVTDERGAVVSSKFEFVESRKAD